MANYDIGEQPGCPFTARKGHSPKPIPTHSERFIGPDSAPTAPRARVAPLHVEKAKYEVCKYILIYMHKKGLSQRQLAKKMEIPESRVSEIVHHKIGKFTLDKLVSYYEKLNPKVSLSVA